MRPYRSIIFTRIDRINCIKKWDKEEKRIKYYDIAANIGLAILTVVAIVTVSIMLITILGQIM